jgi:hypothetical protein
VRHPESRTGGSGNGTSGQTDIEAGSKSDSAELHSVYPRYVRRSKVLNKLGPGILPKASAVVAAKKKEPECGPHPQWTQDASVLRQEDLGDQTAQDPDAHPNANQNGQHFAAKD